MSATRRTFAVAVTIDEADTAKTADKIRRLLESNGYRQATCDYDVYAVYEFSCDVERCPAMVTVGKDVWGFHPENREQAIHEIKHKGWTEGKHGIQAGHLYCPEHAKDIWEES